MFPSRTKAYQSLKYNAEDKIIDLTWGVEATGYLVKATISQSNIVDAISYTL